MPKPLDLDVFVKEAGSSEAVLSERVSLTEYGAYLIGRGVDAQLVIDVDSVSRRHAVLTYSEDGVTIRDEGSSNGTFIGDAQVAESAWDQASPLYVSPQVVILPAGATPPNAGAAATSASAGAVSMPLRPSAAPASDDMDPFADQEVVDEAAVRAHPKFIGATSFAALGGGVGSFVWVDHLRVFGAPAETIRVFGDNPVCYGNYERYCRNSQLPRHERLRSNSISAPDNIWGSPGYASREAWAGLKRGSLKGVGALLDVFGEPVFSISYTPQAGQVFASLDREMARIGWSDMFRQAKILDLKKTNGENYLISLRLFDREGSRPGVAYALARYVHIATGYPAARFVEDLQSFKAAGGDGSERVVNAYDPHDHVYDALKASNQPATVVVRGRGIVASRIVQKLVELRDAGASKLRIVHLMRSEKRHGEGAVFRRARRPVFNDVEIQPFNWPKACWSGDLRNEIEGATPNERARIYKALGGTSTAERSDWTEIVTRGAREGWYVKYYGSVEALTNMADANRLRARIELAQETPETREVEADFVIDCTGLISELSHSRFLSRLIGRYRLERNNAAPGGARPQYTGLAVSNAFEIEGLRNGAGRVYASGQITSGGPYAAVDSFLGLQYAALRATDDLRDVGAPHISSFGPIRSFQEWLRWCQNAPPRALKA